MHSSSPSDSQWSLNNIDEARVPHARWWTTVTIGDYRIRALLDNGASRTCFGPIGLQIAAALKATVHPYMGSPVYNASGVAMPIGAQVKLPIKVANKRKHIVAYVANELDYDCVLGADWHVKFNAMIDPTKHVLILDGQEVATLEFETGNSSGSACLAAIGPDTASAGERREIENILDEFVPITQEKCIGRTHLIEHTIDVSTTRPIRQRCYPVSQKLEEVINSTVKQLLKDDIIEPSTSSWSSPVVLIKKGEGKYRFCIDFRKLNAVTTISARPMPFMDSILRKLRNARYISTIDLSSAFNQVPIKPEHRHYTAFTVPNLGLFQYKTMPFGLSGAPATFQSLMDKIIGPDLEPFVFYYLDDIIIATDSFEQHTALLRVILSKLKASGLTINREKSHFCRDEVRYLGVLVNRDGYRPDPDKIAPIVQFPVPNTLKKLRSFLGAAGWYRKFIPNFATLAEPLVSLTRKDVKFTWTSAQQLAFDQLKAQMASAPILSRPEPGDDRFVIQTDASNTGLGAVLSQVVDGEERILEFASRTMTPQERNYSVSERECLAVLWAVRKFRSYIEGYKFKVITDHSSLKWLHNLKNPTGRLARWSLELQDQNMQIEYRAGSLNLVPDVLSRMTEDASEAIATLGECETTSDKWYKDMYTKISEKPADWPNWKILGGKLYRYKPDTSLDLQYPDHEAWKLVLPREKRAEALAESHDEPTAGHMGRRKTYLRIALQYYWPSIQKDVAEYVKNCFVCQQCKIEQLAPAGLIGRRKLTRPWEMIAVDITGPFPRSSSGHESLLIVMDMFTRYIECIPIRKANAVTIKRMLMQRIFLRYGAADVILSDNGSEFQNEELETFYADLGITPMYVPPYHPQANPVERVNRTVKTMIVSFLEKSHTKWDEHVVEIAFAYNTAIHDTTGASPAYLNYGRHPKLPGSLRQREDLQCLQYLDKEALAVWKERMDDLYDFYDVVSSRVRKAQIRQAKYFNKKHREVVFEIGDIVLKRNRILSSAANKIAAKLAPKYNGPFVVTNRISANIYELRDRQGNESGQVHVKDLKRYYGNSHEYYADQTSSVEDSSKTKTKTMRGRPRKTRVIVKRLTIGKPQTFKNRLKLNLSKTINAANDSTIVTPVAPEALGKRRRGRPKGSKKTEIELAETLTLSPRRTRASAKREV